MLNKGNDITDYGLCKTCKNSMIIKYKNRESEIKCWELGEKIKEPVFECSEYLNKSHFTEDELTKIAWEIDINSIKKDKIGFYKPGDPNRSFGKYYE